MCALGIHPHVAHWYKRAKSRRYLKQDNLIMVVNLIQFRMYNSGVKIDFIAFRIGGFAVFATIISESRFLGTFLSGHQSVAVALALK
jgi:hypothetical protein